MHYSGAALSFFDDRLVVASFIIIDIIAGRNEFYTTLPFAERGQNLTGVYSKSAFRDARGVVHRPLY